MLTPFALESLQAIDHHWHKPMFVTVGDTATWWQWEPLGAMILQLSADLRHLRGSQVDAWDYNRSAPLSSFEWGCERVITVPG